MEKIGLLGDPKTAKLGFLGDPMLQKKIVSWRTLCCKNRFVGGPQHCGKGALGGPHSAKMGFLGDHVLQNNRSWGGSHLAKTSFGGDPALQNCAFGEGGMRCCKKIGLGGALVLQK